MKRIYHTWDKWECYPAGLYETKAKDLTAHEAQRRYAAFLRDDALFAATLKQLFKKWPKSCEHYLSNEKMNRIAWLGQASVCLALGIPQCFCGGFNLLSAKEQARANETALVHLNLWLKSRKEPPVSLIEAGIKAEVNLY